MSQPCGQTLFSFKTRIYRYGRRIAKTSCTIQRRFHRHYESQRADQIAIDLGFVALELATLTAPADLRKPVGRYAAPAILGTLAVLALMNAFAFAAIPAVGLGCAIPALIFALTKTAATLAFHQR